ncbi:helix-turn-helix transcriptional regulator [Actinomycetospora atypica]|uniref:Response regulator transcription factor n=1 Tax=Actinomycetospora atypica TaxID=1290095 RepID=A0ABV9YJD3_9PSEU
MSVCVIYDDRRHARERLAGMFAPVPGVERLIGVTSADELVDRLAVPGRFGVVGTQRAVRAGVTAVERLLAHRPGAAVIAVGAADDCGTASAAVAAGARGFVRWDAEPVVVRSLVHALAVTAGPEPSRARRGPDASADPDDVFVHPTVQNRLGISRRELQVLAGISQGLSNAAIGRELYLSDNTVKSHARRLFGKLGVHERAHAVALAYRCGLFASSTEVPTPWTGHPDPSPVRPTR